MAERRYNVLASTDHGTMIVNRFDRWIGLHLVTYGIWDRTVLAILRALTGELKARMKRPAIAVDVGANIGAIAVPLARMLEGQGTVHAFEPQRLIYYLLCGNAALGSLENLHCHRFAVSDSAGRIELPGYRLDQTVNIGAYKVDAEVKNDFDGVATGVAEPVDVISLDEFGLPAVDILKIDVEGMEPKVLKGATRLIEAHRPAILFEAWAGPGDSLQEFFWSRDYQLFAFGDDSLALPRGKFRWQPSVPEIQRA